jgi:hypothetical protein
LDVTVAQETQQIVELLDRIEAVEQVARTLDVDDERRAALMNVVSNDLEAASPVRPITAASLLVLSEKTVRAWAREGVLTVASNRPRFLLDLERVHEVRHLVDDLRAAGKQEGLLAEVHRRLVDARGSNAKTCSKASVKCDAAR